MKGEPLKNDANFEAAMKLMERGGCLHISPEGLSEVERRLRKIRTGTARIALGAESRNDFKLGIRIQPVGITYTDQLHFRNDCMIIMGEPIKVADFKDEWLKDDREAVRLLTGTIRQRLTDITLVTQDDEEDQLLLAIEDIQRSAHPLDLENHLWRTKKLQSSLRTWKVNDSHAYDEFRKGVAEHAGYLKQIKTSNRALIYPSYTKSLLRLLVTFPFFLLGYINHFLCCWLAKKSNDWFNDVEAYIPTFKYVTGLVTFPLFYVLQTWLVFKITGSTEWTWAYVLSIIPSGFVSDWWLREWKSFIEKWNLSRAGKDVQNKLIAGRQWILDNKIVGETT
jgi:hypothetical protein